MCNSAEVEDVDHFLMAELNWNGMESTTGRVEGADEWLEEVVRVEGKVALL